jgi:hypothetical protein
MVSRDTDNFDEVIKGAFFNYKSGQVCKITKRDDNFIYFREQKLINEFNLTLDSGQYQTVIPYRKYSIKDNKGPEMKLDYDAFVCYSDFGQTYTKEEINIMHSCNKKICYDTCFLVDKTVFKNDFEHITEQQLYFEFASNLLCYRYSKNVIYKTEIEKMLNTHTNSLFIKTKDLIVKVYNSIFKRVIINYDEAVRFFESGGIIEDKLILIVDECPICLDSKDCYKGYFKCSHHLCKECFGKFDNNPKCMMCRSELNI